MSFAVACRASVICCALGYPFAAFAQDTPPTAWGARNDANAATTGVQSSWLGAWSPLRSIGDIPRGLLRAPLSPGLLAGPSPMAGAFILAGAPGSLARDLVPRLAGDTARFGELHVRTARERGEFRRPLDVADNNVAGVGGSGWAPTGRRGIAIGSFTIDRENIGESAFTARVAPYGSSLFVFTDSVLPPMQRTRARLEGALGLRLGPFGVGLSAGVDAREHNSVNAPLRRNGKSMMSAANVGAERSFSWAGLRIGGFFRWSQPTETNILNPAPLPGITVYAIQGFEEPFGLPLPAGRTLIVRNDRHATSTGGTLEATVFGARVVVVHEQSRRAEDQYTQITSRLRPIDRWRATGHETRAQAQRVLGDRVRATLVGSHQSLAGEAVRKDLTGIAVRGAEERMAIEADMRMTLGTRWSTALVGGISNATSGQEDFVADLSIRRDATTPFVAGELARKLGIGTQSAVAVGFSAAMVSPSGSVPAIAGRGPNYLRLVAPALAYELANAHALSVWITTTAEVRGTVLFTNIRGERVAPSADAETRMQPNGDRGLLTLTIGWRP